MSYFAKFYYGNICLIIKDISKLSELTNLKVLWLADNQIADISKLGGLTNLTNLDLNSNQISNINALSGLTNLKVLELHNNQISNIGVLSGFTNLKVLWLADNQIADISKLDGLTNLTILELRGNQISNINSLNSLTNLTDLNLSNNQISDITTLSGLTSLKELYLSGNQISNIGVLSELKNLTYLWLADNQINDISKLSGLTKLESLMLRNNQISDITTLSGLTNLKFLDLNANQISNIDSLSGLTELTDLWLAGNQINDISKLGGLKKLSLLYLENNQISDARILDNQFKEITLGFSLKSQSIEIKSDTGIVELPKIFLQAKDENSKLYTSSDYILTNCTLSSDGKSVVINEGASTAEVKIFGGYADGTILNINNNSLKLNVIKTPEKITNQNVKVTIKSEKTLQPLDGWSLSDDKLSLTKEYEENTTELVTVTSEDGKRGVANVIITNIDKQAPDIEYSTDKKDDGSLEVILKANEKVQEVEGWNLSEDRIILTKTYTEAAKEKISIYDLAGNKTDVEIKVVFKANQLETEEVKIEEIKNNPKTGSNVLNIAFAILSACIMLCVSKIHIKKVSKKI